MRRQLTIEIISSLLILLFLYTALSKLLEFTAFNYVLSKLPLIGSMAAVVALALPITEGLVSVLLFFPRTRLWGLYSALALMTGFTAYLAYMIFFTPHLPCSCGGVLKQMTWSQHLIFNILFLLLSLAGVVLQRKLLRKETEPSPVVFT